MDRMFAEKLGAACKGGDFDSQTSWQLQMSSDSVTQETGYQEWGEMRSINASLRNTYLTIPHDTQPCRQIKITSAFAAGHVPNLGPSPSITGAPYRDVETQRWPA